MTKFFQAFGLGLLTAFIIWAIAFSLTHTDYEDRIAQLSEKVDSLQIEIQAGQARQEKLVTTLDSLSQHMKVSIANSQKRGQNVHQQARDMVEMVTVMADLLRTLDSTRSSH